MLSSCREFKKIATELNRSPALSDLPNDMQGAIKRWLGGISAANEMAGLMPNTKGHSPYTKLVLRELLIDFYVTNKRLPRNRDFGGGCLPAINTYKAWFGTVAAAFEFAGLSLILHTPRAAVA